ARPMLRMADAVLGGPMLSDVADFLLDLRTIYDQLTNRSKTIERHLRSADTVVVTTADPTPIHETHRFFDELANVSVRPACVVFNQTLPWSWTSELGRRTPSGIPADIAANLRAWAGEAVRQRDAAVELERRLHVPVYRIAAAVPAPTNLDDLVSLIRGTDLEAWLVRDG
ncbi:MAG: hypothetical protein KDB69_07975, partial [Acidimicrobiia bacterium]|nr:hypothetical protein [Acidimicrobiia bacterium]